MDPPGSSLSHIAPDLRALAVPISDVTPDPENLRTHDQRNLDTIAESLQRFGQVKPIVVREETGIVVAGNGTLAAALILEWTHIAISRKSLSDAEARALAILDNRTSDLSGWDETSLALAVDELSAEGFDLGFSDEEVEEMLNRLAESTRPTASAPAEPAEPSGEDGIRFQFGEVRGIVEQDVYERFYQTYEAIRGPEVPTLSDVLEKLLR